MKFKIKSKFKPSGDQPKAIEKLVGGIKSGRHDQVLLGVTGSGKTFTVANVIAKTQKPTIVIAHNKTLAAQLTQEFREFFPENAVEYLLKREVFEEAGIQIEDNLKYINSVAFIRPDGIPVVLVKFAAKYKSGGVILEKNAFTDFAWVNELEIFEYDCIEGIEEEIRKTAEMMERK